MPLHIKRRLIDVWKHLQQRLIRQISLIESGNLRKKKERKLQQGCDSVKRRQVSSSSSSFYKKFGLWVIW